jgi:uncharacterized protein YkwD
LLALRKLAVPLALAAVLWPATSQAKNFDPSIRMAERINDVRAEHGLRPLKVAPRLTRSATRYARRMIKTDHFGHGRAYLSAGFKRSGEILAWRRGWSLKPGPIVRMWMNSSGHRSLILSSGFRYIGAGPARGDYGGAGTTMWVVHFGAH